MSRFTAIVADDEKNLRDYLCEKLSLVWPELEVLASAANGREALEAIEKFSPDVAFLDIRMPGLSGIEVAARIGGSTHTVFVTAFDDYAIEAFEHAAVDYLLKPVDEERLALTVERLKSVAPTPEPTADLAKLSRLLEGLNREEGRYLNWIRVGQQGETRIVPVTEIAYFKADHKYTSVRTLAGEHLIRKSIKDLEAELDPERFWRVHRSTLVNLDFLDVARRDFRGRFTLHLKGLSQTLKVSDTYSHLFRQM